MRVQAFIASGMLEKYALGMTTEDENREILEMASQYIEIKEELAAIRTTLEQYIISHKVMPPETLKETILNGKSTLTAPAPTKNGHPASSKAPAYKPARTKKQSSSTGLNLTKIVIGLLTFALVAACYVAFSFYQVAKDAEASIATAQAETSNLQKELEGQKKATAEVEAQLGFYTDRNNKVVMLTGSRRASNSQATIYWNDEAKTGAIDIAKLPLMKEGRVAVLWNTGSVKSVKMGVLKTNAPGELTSIDYLEDASLFYVTEEESADVERPDRSRILMRGQ